MNVRYLITDSFTNSFSGPPSNRLTYHIFGFFLLFMSVCILIAPVSAETVVTLSPNEQSVETGSEFVVEVYVEPDVPISGMQFDLYFDGSLLDVNGVSEGDIFSRTATTWFNKNIIDDSSGSSISVQSVLFNEEVTSPGVLANITFEARRPGFSYLELANVMISNSSGSSVPIYVNDAVVTISDTSSTEVNTGSTGSGSSGGGGAGGAGDSGERFENIVFKDVAERTVIKGKNLSYTFSEPDNPIINVNFTPLRNSGSVTTTIEVLKGRSALVSNDPDGLVYKNMNIWVGKYGFATPANIEAMNIGFRVENSWLEANGVNSSAIRLNRYSEGKWLALQTMVAGEKEGYVYFESSTPGFSPFAITAVTPENGSSGDEVQVADNSSSEDSGIDESEDQTLEQNMVLVLLIVFMFLAVKRGRDI